METPAPASRIPRDPDIEALRAELERVPSEEARARALAILERIERRDARLAAVVQDQPEPLFRFHAAGRITFVNAACCAYWQRERVELLGRPVGNLLPPEGLNALMRASQRLTPEEPVAVLELRVLGAGGEVRWHRWSLRLVVADLGVEVGLGELGRVEFQVLATDISDLKDQHQILAQHIAERRRSDRAHRAKRRELEARLAQRDAELVSLRRMLAGEAQEQAGS
jgi:PAS domain S-box-containing protein